MIRVIKPSKPPSVLERKGRAAREALCHQFDRSPQEYIVGKKKFSFDPSVYGHRSVKEALRQAQHHKCAFCESKVSHVSHGDVEHYRPKGCSRQTTKAKASQPGYYWLAYEWNNLFFCCQICNQRHKKDLFPLSNPRQRAQNHHDDVGFEKPLFIDPATDPGALLAYREEYAYAVNGKRSAGLTIEALGLNRELLVDQRRSFLHALGLLVETRSLLVGRNASGDCSSDERSMLEKIDNHLRFGMHVSGEYSAMVRCFLKERVPGLLESAP